MFFWSNPTPIHEGTIRMTAEHSVSSLREGLLAPRQLDPSPSHSTRNAEQWVCVRVLSQLQRRDRDGITPFFPGARKQDGRS